MSSAKCRRGTVTLELLFALPVVLAMLLGTVMFSQFLTARQMIVNAARESARVAALGGDALDIQDALEIFLGEPLLEITQVNLLLTQADGTPAEPGDPVAVTVAVPVKAVVPDLLGFIGFGWGNSKIVVQAVMFRE